MEAEGKRRKMFRFCSDITDLGRFGLGSGWNWFKCKSGENKAHVTLDWQFN